MPQSLSKVALHLIFSTKERRRVFRTEEMRAATSAYLAGILKNVESPAIRIATVVDHVHILHLMPRTQTIADIVGITKRESSTWVKEQPWARLNADFAQFHWQKGYGAFSVSESRIPAVLDYINSQQEHHKRLTFQDEYRKFLERHDIGFDERYVWD